VEADLLRFYQVDLLDFWRTPRTLSTRRLLVLFDAIPQGQGAAVHTIDGPEWSIEADIADLHRRWYQMVHAEGREDPGPHRMHPQARQEQVAPSDEVVAHVAKLKAERERAIAAGEIA
jgi:hypothetical protein